MSRALPLFDSVNQMIMQCHVNYLVCVFAIKMRRGDGPEAKRWVNTLKVVGSDLALRLFLWLLLYWAKRVQEQIEIIEMRLKVFKCGGH